MKNTKKILLTTDEARLIKRRSYFFVTKDGVKIQRVAGRIDNLSMEDARKAVASAKSLMTTEKPA